jgi:hypothetical protein
MIDSGGENLADAKPHDHLKAVESEHAYDDSALKVSVEGIDGPLHNHIATAIKESGLELVKSEPARDGSADPSSAPDLKIVWDKPDQPNTITVIRNDGIGFFKFEPSPEGSKDSANQMDLLKQALRDEATWRFVKKMHSPETEHFLAVECRVVPVNVQRNSRGKPTKITRKTATDGDTKLQEGDDYQIDVTNTGHGPVFVHVIEIEENGKIAGLYVPGSGQDETVLEPGKDPWTIPQIFTEQGPYGKELIKVIATSSPADFGPIVTDTKGGTRAFDTKTPNNPLARLLLGVNRTGKTRGPKVSSLPDDYTIADFPMRTVEKETEKQVTNPEQPAHNN